MPVDPYVAPAASPAPLEGQALLVFLQGWVVGVTGMDGTLVRPRWQAEPANIPDAGNAWAAIGVGIRPADTYPFVGNVAGADPVNPNYKLVRHEELELLCSFYDTGSTGLADQYAALLRDGSAIPNNRIPLRAAGFAFVSADPIGPVPTLLKERWLYRVDFKITLRRQIDRVYPVPTVQTVDIGLKANDLGDGIYQKNITISQP
jgi:hypothetical protein